MAINQITRNNVLALQNEQFVNEIIQALPTQSVFLRLAKQMPRMTAQQLRVPVLTGLANAYFVNGDSGKKQTTNLTWDKVYINAEEIAVMVPIPEAVLADSSYDIWAEVRPRIVEAFGKAIDKAVFFGVNKPDSWPTGIVPGAIAAGKTTTLYANATGPDIYQAIMGVGGVLANVEEQGIGVNGHIGALQLRARLRGAVDDNKQPIFTEGYSNAATGVLLSSLAGVPINFPDNGCWNADTALLLSGDFSYARYAIRQDMTFKIFDQGTITDEDAKVALSAMEQDCVIMRCVMRLGWALPKPVNPISGTSYYPFSILQATTDKRVGAISYSVTAPVKSATPQSTHAAGTGYTAAIAWSPSAASFAGNKVYTATVTYTAADGYVFEDGFSAEDVIGLPATTGDSATATAVTVTRVDNTHVKAEVVYVATEA